MTLVSNRSLAIKLTVLLIFVALLIVVYGFSSGPLPGRTGGFGEPTCNASGCHNSFQLNAGWNMGGSFRVTGIPGQYQPNTVYPITVTITQPGQVRWGFELAARFQSNGMQAGTLMSIDGNTQIVPSGGIQYIEHTLPGTMLGTSSGTWRFNWQAPAQAAGPIVFNAAGNAANGDGTPLGDYIYTLDPSDLTKGIVSQPPQQVGECTQPNNTFFAQFANGSGITSTLTLTNPGSSAVTACIAITDDNGNPLNVSLSSNPPGLMTNNFSIPPRGSVIFTTDGQGNLVTGSVRVGSSATIGGVLLFTVPPQSTGVGQSQPLGGFITPITREGDLRTGVAIRNATDNAVTLTIILHALNGSTIGSPVTNMLPGRGHVARFADEFFPSIPTSFRGTMEVTSSGGANSITATALRFGGGEFTTLPVTQTQ